VNRSRSTSFDKVRAIAFTVRGLRTKARHFGPVEIDDKSNVATSVMRPTTSRLIAKIVYTSCVRMMELVDSRNRS
jgi:hypothetical protein